MATPTTITEKDVLPLPDEIKEMKKSELIEFLRRQEELELDEEELEILEKEKVTGRHFLLLTKKDLLKVFNLGTAVTIADFIDELKKPRSTGLVHVFVDNSNLFIEGKFNIGQLECIFDVEKNLYHINQLHIKYGQLLALVQDGCGLGGAPVLVGSRPPPNDSLWKHIRKQGYDVTVHARNAENREKKVDVEISVSIMDTIQNYNPDMVLEFWYGNIVVFEVTWVVQVHTQNNLPLGISNDLISKVLFKPLDICYKSFSCGYRPEPTGKKQVLEITDGNMIRGWGDKEVMECFTALNLFCWWNWLDETLCLYFDNQWQLEWAKHWMEVNHPDLRVWEKKEIKRRSWT
ncbi:3503_t:CDS:2 [Entrophospora sp. SA101]|nr:3503_t:CDS:2 [Entrophospora sp. SA101]CAJ0910622.1 10219_t:CDS:2 [Entrophospora sp. SA101]